jgi:hypothetical protein
MESSLLDDQLPRRYELHRCVGADGRSFRCHAVVVGRHALLMREELAFLKHCTALSPIMLVS